MPVDRLERLVNLVAALIDTPQPITREQIHQRIDGYSEDAEAFRRNFERDKDLLRQMGLPLATVPLDPSRPDEVGYQIRREDYELPDAGLDEHELAALRLASAAVQIEGTWGRDATTRALRKLGGAVSDDPSSGGASGLADLPAGDAVAVVFGAVAERRQIRFAYRGEERLVDPWRMSFRRGQWYVAGLDHHRGEERLFRLDRVEGAITADGPRDAFVPPPDRDASPPPAWQLGDEESVVVDLLVDAHQARWAERALGEQTVTERRPDGGVVFAVPVSNVEAFRSLVLGFLDHAEILGPAPIRVAMVAWLDQLAGERAGGPSGG